MSMHKLTAGSGYDYLTRQVAAQDASDKGHTGLASYYTARGETPGRWVGSGMAGIDGLTAGDVVTAEQMQALFGSGHHPLAQQRREHLHGPGLSEGDHRAVTRLGVPFKVYTPDVSAFRLAVAQRIAAPSSDEGHPGERTRSGPVSTEQRARIRTQVAVEFFRAEHGRDPQDAREIAATIARHSRPRTTAVAGYDLTFSPVKSVSTLWAIADPATAARIERAHQAAVRDALTFLEEHALFTRTGTDGVRQVNVRGLVAAVFTHRDSRAGDPDLHTHVAVANKVQTLDPEALDHPTGAGRWLSIDGRVLFKANVAASETYNTALEMHLTADLGLRFEERPSNPRAYAATGDRTGVDGGGGAGSGSGSGKRAIREVVGVDPRLNDCWSQRRASIQARRGELATAFQATHGRPPTEVESIQLAQQATLETRAAKKEPRTLAEQRQAWRTQAADVLGGDRAVTAMVATALDRTAHGQAASPSPPPAGRASRGRGRVDRASTPPGVDGRVEGPVDGPVDGADTSWVQDTAATILSILESRRSTWQVWHVRAEALRQVRARRHAPLTHPGLPGWEGLDQVVERVTRAVLDHRSVRLTPAGDGMTEPPPLRRRDGSSVYTVHGADLFTSTRVLDAEQRIVAAGARRDGHAVPAASVDLALLELTANGVTLNAGQVALVRGMATSRARLQLAIAPAGTGKTTAMRALAAAWENGGGTLIGLAPSAAAAAALRDQIDPSHADPVPADPGTADPGTADPGTVDTGRPDRPSSSVAAASVVASRAPVRTDTLAKLTWAIQHPHLSDLPLWAQAIGPDTLVVIDEAGMADTISLDTAVQFVVSRGGSVRLIGDDQQLAAIGAGGVLRDLDATYGVLRLSELLRFADPAEGAATLALRDGLPEALGFYLDQHRVHVGDLTTMTETVFTAWEADRAGGLDAIMLAPTRELVAQLNHRARAHRLTHTSEPAQPGQPDVSEPSTSPHATGPSVQLADGNHASAGDLIITRTNDRRLRVSSCDWVKNGDRWTVLQVHQVNNPADPAGRRRRPGVPGSTVAGQAPAGLTVQHARNGRIIQLPADYVAASTELGYATTVHGAQGVSVDAVHALATGGESRQQLYTMLTRGRLGNHLYLEVVSDGDPHNAIRPDAIAPPTATDLLQRVLARDDSPVSATTMLADLADPAALLGQASARYTDAVYVAAEDLLGHEGVITLERSAEALLPGLTDEPAWPTLRAHLILLSAHSHVSAHSGDPATQATGLLADAMNGRELATALDRAAVLDWRLNDTALTGEHPTGGHPNTTPHRGPGPLPWLPAVPPALSEHPTWGDYLNRREALVTDLSSRVRTAATTSDPTVGLPGWARQGAGRPAPEVLGDVAVWRAATQVPAQDRRPTGAPQRQKVAFLWQQRLNRAVTGDRAPALQEWGDLLRHLTSPLTRATAPTSVTGTRDGATGRRVNDPDDFIPLLAERLAAISRAGLPARRLLDAALAEGPLPDDHAAAAVWWRLSRNLTPAVATLVRHQVDRTHDLGPDHPLVPTATQWASALDERVGQERAELMKASSWWPTLVTSIDHALQRGWALSDILGATRSSSFGNTNDSPDPDLDLDPCQAMVWRLSMLTNPPPLPEDLGEEPRRDPRAEAGLAAGAWDTWGTDERPNVLLPSAHPPAKEPSWSQGTVAVSPRRDRAPSADHQTVVAVRTSERLGGHAPPRGDDQPKPGHVTDDRDVGDFGGRLLRAAIARSGIGPLAPSDAAIERQVAHAADLDFAPIPPNRMLEVNQMTLAFFQSRYPSSWAQQYLTDHLGQDPAEHGRLSRHFRPGYAPPGWDTLVRHLRRYGVTDQEMTETGVATRARTGRLIDRFRDRVIMPIAHHGQILGFVGRRHPALTDHRPGPDHSRNSAGHSVGPKYLNTADTPLFHKGAQLFGVVPALLKEGVTPVLVEGPLDAWAVTLATHRTRPPCVGVAPLGTALTEEQAEQMAHLGRTPIVATDADLPGRAAAERDFWLLTPHGIDPVTASFPEGSDPADVLARRGPAALIEALWSTRPLGDHLLQKRLDHLTGDTALTEAVHIAAARPAETWEPSAITIAARLGIPPLVVHQRLADAVEAWNSDPRAAAAVRLAGVQQVRARLTANNGHTPQVHTDRWAELARHIDPRLPSQGDWPALAAIMTLAHRDGYDVEALAHQLVAAEPLGRLPAQDLRYRLVAALPLDLGPAPDRIHGPGGGTPLSGAERDRRSPHVEPQRSTGRQR